MLFMKYFYIWLFPGSSNLYMYICDIAIKSGWDSTGT